MSGTKSGSLDSVLDQVESGHWKPLYVLAGSEDYLVLHARKHLVRAISRHFSSMVVDTVDFNEIQPDEIIGRLNSPSLFEPFKIMIIRDLELTGAKGAGTAAGLTSWADMMTQRKTPLHAMAIVTCKKIDKRLGVVKKIKKYGEIMEFEIPASYDRGDTRKDTYYSFAVRHLQNAGKNLAPQSWMTLRQRAANNMWAITNALDVLISFSGDRKDITEDDIREIIPIGEDIPVFSITEALGSKDAIKLREQLEILVHAGNHPLLISKLVAKRLRLIIMLKGMGKELQQGLWRPNLEYFRFKQSVYPVIRELISADEVLTELVGSMHPYPLYLSMKQAGQIDLGKVSRCLVDMAEIDILLKSTTKPPVALLEAALLPVCT